MREEYVNAFLNPAKKVWEQELGQSLEVASADMTTSQVMDEDITVVIGISGTLQGNVLYGFSDATAEGLVKTMTGEEEVDIKDEIGLSVLGEVANMITGNAITALAEAGYPCEISPPVIFEPAGNKLMAMGGPQILVSFVSELGPFSVRIAIYPAAGAD